MLFQAGLAVTVLRSQRTAYDKLAADNASILRKLDALKRTDGNGVSVYCVGELEAFGAFKRGPKFVAGLVCCVGGAELLWLMTPRRCVLRSC